MGKSVKLTDGSYIDSEGVYDVTQSKTQKAINADVKDIKAKRIEPNVDKVTTVTATWSSHSPTLVIIDQNSFIDAFICDRREIIFLHKQSEYSFDTPTVKMNGYGFILTFQIQNWGSALILSTIMPTVITS